VVLDQGVTPPESVVVEEVCGNTVRARTRTDLRGGFTLALGQASAGQSAITGDASEGNDPDRVRQTFRVAGCELRGVLGGYISTQLQLDGSDAEVGMSNVGTIVLKRIGGVQSGSTVSVTSYQVPDKARKEYEKAIKALQQQQTKSAEEHLRKAVEIYPKYAAAWVSFGELHKQVGLIEEAKADFEKAIEADPNYVTPYVHLAYFSANSREWVDVLKLTEQAIRLDPLAFADAHFLNAVANFNLQHLEEAKRSALRAAELDQQHRIPRIHHLLSAIYEASGDRELAAAQLREYLKIAPTSPEAAAARERLQQLGSETAKAQ
jgi:Tfp pilus assembly protein PilF